MVADLAYRGADGRPTLATAVLMVADLDYRGADGRRPCLPRC